MKMLSMILLAAFFAVASFFVLINWDTGTMGMETMSLPSGQGHRVTSVTDLSDGRGFILDLEVIEQTTLFGPDINKLRMTVRWVLHQCLNLVFVENGTTKWLWFKIRFKMLE